MPRNAQGQYYLPDGNPVVPGTTIQADWANPTLEDIAQALSDSLDRDGQGGMKAPLKHVDGSEATPSMTFTNDTSTGLSLKSTGVIGVSCGGKSVAEVSKNGVTMVNDTEVFVSKAPSSDSSLTNKKYVSEAIAATFVIGMISMFATDTPLPNGWKICDGTNGTVDLRDKFIVASGSKFAAGSTGGSLKIGVNNMPSHSHGGTTGGESAGHTHDMGASDVQLSGGTTGGGGSHSHGVSDPGHNHGFTNGGSIMSIWGSGNSWSTPGGGPVSYGNIMAAGTGIGIQGVGDHTHPISGTARISGETGQQSTGHTHTVGAEGGGADYIQPYFALVFAQFMGVAKND